MGPFELWKARVMEIVNRQTGKLFDWELMEAVDWRSAFDAGEAADHFAESLILFFEVHEDLDDTPPWMVPSSN